MSFQSFNSSSSHCQPMAEINTTPLVDVMLVLLVIFIITAPLFHQAVPVDLPKVDSAKLNDPPKVVQLAINEAGQVFIDGGAVANGELGARLTASVVAGQPTPELHLRADRGSRYERVAEVMAAAQNAGLTKIAFVTEAAGKQ